MEDHLVELKKVTKISEQAVVYNLSRHVLIPLFGSIELEKGYGKTSIKTVQ